MQDHFTTKMAENEQDEFLHLLRIDVAAMGGLIGERGRKGRVRFWHCIATQHTGIMCSSWSRNFQRRCFNREMRGGKKASEHLKFYDDELFNPFL